MKTTRRGFIQQGTALAATGATPWLANLAAIGEASAASALGGDYKALVCLFMLGGNDHANTIVPMDDDSYAKYQTSRKELYYRKDALAMGIQSSAIVDNRTGLTMGNLSPLTSLELPEPAVLPRRFALAPPLTPLKALYDSQKLAVLLNVGTLVEPTVGVKIQDTSQTIELRKLSNDTIKANLPPRLGSHNDQVSIWQASNPEGATVGWGGRVGDELGSGNTKPVFTAVSVAGNAVYLTGKSTVPYQVTTARGGSIPFEALRSATYGSAAVSTVLGQIAIGSGTVTTASHMLERDLTAVTRRSISADDVLRGMPGSIDDAVYAPLSVLAGNGNGLAAQLRTVAHLINKRATTGATRQVFFVALGGFDLHSGLVANHPSLQDRVATAMAAFQQVLESLPHPESASNPMGMGNNVTTFTASDFGRTFNSNGDGTDHGWGSMHFVMGGAVNGGHLYGKPPVYGDKAKQISGEYYEDSGRGNLIPTTSVDQYAATLARWMGVPEASMGTPEFLPNLSAFALDKKPVGKGDLFNWGVNLGFMKSV